MIQIGVPPLRKQCSSCGQVRLYDHFRQDKRSSDGLRSQCQHCERAYDRERYRRNRNQQTG